MSVLLAVQGWMQPVMIGFVMFTVSSCFPSRSTRSCSLRRLRPTGCTTSRSPRTHRARGRGRGGLQPDLAAWPRRCGRRPRNSFARP